MEFLDVMRADFREIDNDIFSEPVTIKAGAVTVNGRGVYDESYEMVDLVTNTKTISDVPRMSIWKADFAPIVIKRNVEVTVRGRTFYVHEYHDDGEGGTVLLLADKRT